MISLVTNIEDSQGIAADASGNLFIADSLNGAVVERDAVTGDITTLFAGLDLPCGLAVDVAGNVYVADNLNQCLKEWVAASGNVLTLATNLDYPTGVAVDGAGNVYFSFGIDNGGGIGKWTAADNSITCVGLSLQNPLGVAVDTLGNVYGSDSDGGPVLGLAYAFVDTADRLENLATTNDVWQAVLPATNDLLNGIVATTLQPWVNIDGLSNGVLSISVDAAVSNRTAVISLLGQTIPITQGGPTYALGDSNLLEGPSGGSDSVTLAVTPRAAIWTASSEETWLHLGEGFSEGTGTTNLIFNIDANPGPTRVGSLVIAGLNLSVTQAGSSYVAAGTVTPLVSSGLNYPCNLAVDKSGNVFIGDMYLGV